MDSKILVNDKTIEELFDSFTQIPATIESAIIIQLYEQSRPYMDKYENAKLSFSFRYDNQVDTEKPVFGTFMCEGSYRIRDLFQKFNISKDSELRGRKILAYVSNVDPSSDKKVYGISPT